MNPHIKQMFDSNASHFDPERRQLIPCFDDFYGMALSLVESDNPTPRILDLGAGTGLFSGMVLQKYPNAHLTLVDLSDKMMEAAQARFKQTANIEYIVADYTEYEFPGSYDFVISSLSIHHLTHPLKQRLFSKIYPLLQDGGSFINADQAAGHTPQADAYYRKRWLESVYGSGLSEASIQASIKRRELDINAKPEDQLNWLKQAGFADVDCVYKHFEFTVFYAHKHSG
ncbi:class I SAM-dependent methyltransferase [Paenibacillus sp. GCM10012307]|uniref:Methyltransferase domain-containing protein n=1 Tax=Paenibacillus roseus TaxID=2798579 RepID=A0A934MR89_9BACL|nr:class I SAM-dependent methyltransferase [Paenibacillus roseus]MBJ6364001.1 methyltransferase domain-containing protein [Paenibacillus roseus]